MSNPSDPIATLQGAADTSGLFGTIKADIEGETSQYDAFYIDPSEEAEVVRQGDGLAGAIRFDRDGPEYNETIDYTVYLLTPRLDRNHESRRSDLTTATEEYLSTLDSYAADQGEKNRYETLRRVRFPKTQGADEVLVDMITIRCYRLNDSI